MGKVFKFLSIATAIIFSLLLGFFAGQSTLPPADREVVEAAIESTVAAIPTQTPWPTSAPIIVTVEKVVERVITVGPPTPTATSAPPTITTTVEPVTFYVGDTDGDGVYLRREAGGDERIKAWPDGTKMVRIGPFSVVGERSWENVRDPDGNEGFVPKPYLLTQQQINAREMLAKRPTPTSRPAGGCTAATRRYITQVERALQEIAEPSALVIASMQQWQEDPSLFFDSRWKYVVKINLFRVAGIINRSLPDSQPRDPAAARIHDQYEKFSGYFAIATSTMAGALEDSDLDRFEKGDHELGEAIQELEAAKALEERLCGS